MIKDSREGSHRDHIRDYIMEQEGRSRTPLMLPIEIRVRDDLMPTNLTLPVVARVRP